MNIDFHDRHVKTLIAQLLNAGLEAADPGAGIRRTCKLEHGTLVIARRRYRLSQYRRVALVGMGKASEKMALTILKLLSNRVDNGLIVVKDPPTHAWPNIEIFQSGHPSPNLRSLRAAKRIQQFVSSLTNQDLLITLISGGASSLLAAPPAGLTLSDKQRTTQLLLKSGSKIQEINTVRKHLSTIKGGQLASFTSATIISLILSDVAGDDPATIGSGVTSADPSTFFQARRILEKYHLWKRVPSSVREHLRKGTQGVVPETLKPNDPRFKHVQHVIIGNNQHTTRHIKNTAKQLGLYPHVQTAFVQGEAQTLGDNISTLARDLANRKRRIRKPALFIWGGEPTVTLTGNGKGGRAQECALSAAIGIAGLRNTIMAGFGTDGSDGPTDVAGAIVDGETILRAQRMKLPAKKFLKAHDSYRFFKKAGGHINTGPTGTNVNDIYLLLLL